MDKRIGFGLYESCANRGNVARLSMFILQWCEWYLWGVFRAWNRVWRGVMVLYQCGLRVRIICVNGRSRYLYCELSGYLSRHQPPL